MPKYQITAPDGHTYEINAPEGASEQDVMAYAQRNYKMAAPGSSTPARTPLKVGSVPANSPDSALGRIASGAALGVADIGNTALNALAYLPGKAIPEIAQWNRTRNADFDALTEANADSGMFKGGRMAGNFAATLPVGGAIGSGIKAIAPALVRLGVSAPMLETLAATVQSGGLKTGAPVEAGASLARRAADLGMRSAGGMVNGAASSALANPDHAELGAATGAILPGAVKLAGAVGQGAASLTEAAAQRLMQSALKPTIAQLRTGDAATAVKTLLDYGISPTMAGIQKLKNTIGDLNDQIAEKIGSSDAIVSKAKVNSVLDGVRQKFSTQVSPTSDLNAIQGVADDFAAHPNIVGDAIPVQLAQALKQGTYKVLAKKYGQVGSAEVEAQKGLARGLKEEIASAVPGVQDLNAQESSLLTTLSVAERRALMDMNKNPMGLAALASSPASWAAFMLDKSALFKALAARSLNSTAQGMRSGAVKLGGMTDQPALAPAVQAISDRRD